MAKIITSLEEEKYYSPITYSKFCYNSLKETLDDFIQNEIYDIIDKIYPIGAYYISTNSTSPAEIFKWGRWELLEEGRTILGAGAVYDISTWETKELTDGSKWAKIYYQDAMTVWEQAEENSLIYDRLDNLYKFYNHLDGESGSLELLLEYEDLNLQGRWIQKAYPFGWSATVGISHDMVLNRASYTALNINEGCYLPETWADFRGLGVSSSSQAQLSGVPGVATKNFGLRNIAKNTADTSYVLADGTNYELKSVSLWVRYDNVICWNNNVGMKGGNSTITLTSSQIPPHNHGIGRKVIGPTGGGDDHGRTGTGISGKTTTSTGGSGAHNNLQPYTKVFVWKRIEEVDEE